MAFSPKGDLFAGAIESAGIVKVWNPATWDAVGQPLTGHTGEITSLAFSPDGKILAVGAGNDTVYLWNTRTGRPAGQLPSTATPSARDLQRLVLSHPSRVRPGLAVVATGGV